MANFLNHIFVFFVLALLLFLQTTSTRESKFFSKITRENTYSNDESKINYSNVQETQAPVKEESKPNKAETSKNGYGHESGQFLHSISNFNFPFRSHYQDPLDNYNTDSNSKDFFNRKTDNRKHDEGTIKDENRDDHLFYSNAVYYNPEYQGLSRTEFVNNDDSHDGSKYHYNLQQQQNAVSDFVDNERDNFDSYSDSTGPNFGHSSYNSNIEDINQEKNKNIGYALNDENVEAYNNGMKGYHLNQLEKQDFRISP